MINKNIEVGDCPVCKAKVTEPCRRIDGRKRPTYHVGRSIIVNGREINKSLKAQREAY